MVDREILVIKNLVDFEKIINRDESSYDINMMVMPGTLQDKHKDVDPEKGIRALRRQFNLIYLLIDGEHDLHLGADFRFLNPKDLVIVPENMIYASTHIRNCQGFCIHFKTEFLKPLVGNTLQADFPFFNWDAEHIINLTDEQCEIIKAAFEDIIREYKRFSPEKDFILRNYIHILLLRIREFYLPYVKRVDKTSNHLVKLTNQFKYLLERHFIDTRGVKQYADMLHVSANYLSDVVKRTLGISPRELINNIVLLEAKSLLGSTDLSVSEIAYRLKFHDQSHFSHFIKKHTGYSPQGLRKKL